MTTFTTPEHRTARKKHECSTCRRVIEPGERYCHGRGFDGRDVWTFKQCAHCEAVVDLYDPRDHDYLISLDGFESWTEGVPRDMAEARAMSGWRMGWRYRYSQRLLSIPTREGES